MEETWRALERRALEWLVARRARIDPNLAPESHVILARKSLIEVALLLALRDRLDAGPATGAYAALRDQVISVARRRSYKELAARDRSAMLLYAATYGALRLCGHEDREFRWILQQVVDARYAAVFERVPFRYLDLLHSLELAEISHNLPSMEDALRLSLLRANPNALELAERDSYAVTHAVFYVTDFGLRDGPLLGDLRVPSVIELLEALLVLYRHRGNVDLVAELVCALACLGVQRSAEVDRAWSYLIAMQQSDGSFPGPPDVIHPDHLGKDAELDWWTTNYHTTVVAILASLMARSKRIAAAHGQFTPPQEAVADEAIRPALTHAVNWLCQQANGRPLHVALPALAAAAYARSVVPPGYPPLHAALRRLALGVDTPAMWADRGADAVLILARAMEEFDIHCPSLSSFLKDVALALERVTEIPVETTASVAALAELKCVPVSTSAELRNRVGAIMSESFERTAGAVHEAGSSVDENTDDLAKRGDELPQDTAERVAFELSESCRNYNITQTGTLLRTLLHLDSKNRRLVRDAIDFLLHQQGLDGGFGFAGVDDAEERRAIRLAWTQSTVLALTDALTEGRAHDGHRPGRMEAA